MGLPHTRALCMTQNVVRYVKMLPGLVILETDQPQSDIRTVGVVSVNNRQLGLSLALLWAWQQPTGGFARYQCTE